MHDILCRLQQEFSTHKSLTRSLTHSVTHSVTHSQYYSPTQISPPLNNPLAMTSPTQRTLSEFQSRKAHRVQWRDRDLIRCLLSMFIVLTFSLASWTAAVVDGLTAMGDLLSTIRIEPRKALALSFSIFSTVQGVCRLSIKDRLLEAGWFGLEWL